MWFRALLINGSALHFCVLNGERQKSRTRFTKQGDLRKKIYLVGSSYDRILLVGPRQGWNLALEGDHRKEKNGKQYEDTAFPITAGFRKQLIETIIAEYEKKANAETSDYEPAKPEKLESSESETDNIPFWCIKSERKRALNQLLCVKVYQTIPWLILIDFRL